MGFHDGYLSEIVGRTAMVGERPIGKVVDFLIEKPDDAFPRIDGFVIATREGQRYVPTAGVIDVDKGGVVVLAAPPELPAKPDQEALYLIADLFDKQIVDVDGRKVVRINDLEICDTGGTLRVVAADIGLSGLLRRLGVHKIAPRLVKRVPPTLIAWNHVAPISEVNPSQVRLSVSGNRLSRLHPSELAEIIADLSGKDASRLFQSLDDQTAADALEHLHADVQKSIIHDIGTERAADIIEEMDSDDAADLLGELDEEKQSELLAEMEPHTAGELRELVRYDENTAGGMMTTDFVWIYPHRSAAATIEKIREIAQDSEFIYYLYVTDAQRKLLGVLSLRTLLLASPSAFIHELMDPEPVGVSPDADAQEVAAMIARYEVLAGPVLDGDDKMLGIVTVDDAIDAIMPEKVAHALPRFTYRHREPLRKSAQGVFP
jgi:CBS domain-containing protein